jgi:hypothetical protein
LPRKLKVFRTPTGFHDAYVAAPSRKAALAAWGANADLFARGTAEEVTDPQLTAEPLKRPGEVIRISRGDLQAQLKALGRRKKPTTKEPQAETGKPPPAAKAPPSRARLDRAESALEEERTWQATERAALERQRQAIDRKLDALDARQEKAMARLETARDKAKSAYRDALDAWSE